MNNRQAEGFRDRVKVFIRLDIINSLRCLHTIAPYTKEFDLVLNALMRFIGHGTTKQ